MHGNISYLRRRSRSNYFTSLISISFVLFFLGLFTVIILFGRSFTRDTKESILLKVFLSEQAHSQAQQDFMDTVNAKPYVLATTFVSKEEAGEQLLQRTGEEVKELLGGLNPLMPSINVKLKSQYINQDSLAMIRQELSTSHIVTEVVYPLDMINSATQNIRIITIIFSFLGISLLVIAFYLILSTIRLSIYAQRLAIRTMQLIGATHAYIRQPFIVNGFLHGFIASVIAVILLWGTFSVFTGWIEDLGFLDNISIQKEFIGLLVGIVLFGTILGVLGSFWAVNRYLDRNTDELV